jgi:hypothetical protein
MVPVIPRRVDEGSVAKNVGQTATANVSKNSVLCSYISRDRISNLISGASGGLIKRGFLPSDLDSVVYTAPGGVVDIFRAYRLIEIMPQ